MSAWLPGKGTHRFYGYGPTVSVRSVALATAVEVPSALTLYHWYRGSPAAVAVTETAGVRDCHGQRL